jgi:hypothetical protein
MYRCAQSSEFRVYSSLPACPSPKPHTRGRVAIDRSRSRGAPRYRRVFLLVLCLTAVSQGNKHRSQSRGKPRGNRSLELIVVMELDESPLSVEAVARGVCVETGVWHTWQKGPWSPTARLDSPQCSARLFFVASRRATAPGSIHAADMGRPTPPRWRCVVFCSPRMCRIII